MKIVDIKPYEKNAKKHPKKHIEQVANSIKEFGMNQPIVVDKQGVIIVGHGRLEPFAGVGSTLIACEKTNRICYAIELSEGQVDVIVQRYVDYTGNEDIIKNGDKINGKNQRQKQR